MKSDNPGLEIFEYQAPSTLVVPGGTVVQDTFYTIIDEVNCRVYGVTVQVSIAGEDLEVEAVVDGQTITGIAAAAVAGTNMIVYHFDSAVTQNDHLNIVARGEPTARPTMLLEGRSVLIRVTKRTNNGAGALTGIARWGQKKNA